MANETKQSITTTSQHRTLGVKLELDWSKHKDKAKAVYGRVQDLGWMEAHYRNSFMRRTWAQAMGYVVADKPDDRASVTKQGRVTDKAELSGAAYSAAEREVAAVWARDRSKIMAGQQLPEWRPGSALSVRGHKEKASSGIRIEIENDQYIAYAQLQSAKCEGGSWLRLPIAKNTRRDEHQGDVLNGMVNWSIPILKATFEIKPHEITMRLTYAVEVYLPPMGERVATLGPINKFGRLLLRTETQTRDYTSKLESLKDKKDRWDQIRRRMMCQLGRRHGHARIKREVLSRHSTEDWVKNHIHNWTRDVVVWCKSQGVSTIRVEGIDTGDWPAWSFVQQLKYKAADLSMVVTENADVNEKSGERAAKAVITRDRKSIKKRQEAIRELSHQVEKTA